MPKTPNPNMLLIANTATTAMYNTMSRWYFQVLIIILDGGKNVLQATKSTYCKLLKSRCILKPIHSPHKHANAIEFRPESQAIIGLKGGKTCAISGIFAAVVWLILPNIIASPPNFRYSPITSLKMPIDFPPQTVRIDQFS